MSTASPKTEEVETLDQPVAPTVVASWLISKPREKPQRWLVICDDQGITKFLYSSTEIPATTEGAFELADELLGPFHERLGLVKQVRKIRAEVEVGRLVWTGQSGAPEVLLATRHDGTVLLVLNRRGIAFDHNLRIPVPEAQLPELARLLRRIVRESKANAKTV